MAKRTTVAGYLRAAGDTTEPVFLGERAPGVSIQRTTEPAVAPIIVNTIRTIDASLPGTNILTGLKLLNVWPVRVDIFTSNPVGGTAPLIDVGISTTVSGSLFQVPNALVDGAPADSKSTVGLGDATAGSYLGSRFDEFSTSVDITVSDGGGTNNTSGFLTLWIYCVPVALKDRALDTAPAVPTTTSGYYRELGSSAMLRAGYSRLPTPGVVPCCATIRSTGSGGGSDFDVALPGTGLNTGIVLPAGARVLRVDISGEQTGGTSPLIDVGFGFWQSDGTFLTTFSDAFVDGAPCDSGSNTSLGDATAGSTLGIVSSTEPTYITVSDGGGTQGSAGKIELHVWYTFTDDGELD